MKQTISLMGLLAMAGAALGQAPTWGVFPTGNPTRVEPVSHTAPANHVTTSMMPEGISQAGCTSCGNNQVVSHEGAPGCTSCGTGGCGPEGCGTGGCAGNGCGHDYNFDCCPFRQHQFYASGEFLIWRGDRTTLPALTTNNNFLGQVNVPQTVNLAFAVNPGGTGIEADFGDFSGYRFTAGYWFQPACGLAIEASYFRLEDETFGLNSQAGNGQTQQFVAIVGGGVANNLVVTGVPTAVVTATLTTSMWGAEVNGKAHGVQFATIAISGLVGGRYINLEDKFNATERVTFTNAKVNNNAVNPGNFSASYNDQITVQNHFFGPQVGVAFDWGFCKYLFLSGWGKVAAGDNRQEFSLSGSTTSNGVTTPGGLLVSSADNGRTVRRDRFAIASELNINCGIDLFSRFRAYAGYDILFINRIARAGDQFATVPTTATVIVNGVNAPLPLGQSSFLGRNTDYLLEGLNLGMEFRY